MTIKTPRTLTQEAIEKRWIDRSLANSNSIKGEREPFQRPAPRLLAYSFLFLADLALWGLILLAIYKVVNL